MFCPETMYLNTSEHCSADIFITLIFSRSWAIFALITSISCWSDWTVSGAISWAAAPPSAACRTEVSNVSGEGSADLSTARHPACRPACPPAACSNLGWRGWCGQLLLLLLLPVRPAAARSSQTASLRSIQSASQQPRLRSPHRRHIRIAENFI